MNEFITWVVGIVTKNGITAPSCDQKDAGGELTATNRSTGQPEAIAAESGGVIMNDIDDYEHADHSKSDGWLRAHGYDESDE